MATGDAGPQGAEQVEEEDPEGDSALGEVVAVRGIGEVRALMLSRLYPLRVRKKM